MHCGAGTYMVQCVMCKATTDDGCLDRISANWNRRSPETAEDRTYRVLAAVSSPDNGTVHEVLSAVLACANAWVPEARIIGNVRAGDIARAIAHITAEPLPVAFAPSGHLKRYLEGKGNTGACWVYARPTGPNDDKLFLLNRREDSPVTTDAKGGDHAD
jgi:hypothetical protein